MDHYEVLGIRPNASNEEIDLAYKGRRSQYHPDRYSDEEARQWATVKMQEVNAAHAALADPIARARVDQQRASASASQDAGNAVPEQAQATTKNDRPAQFPTLGEFLRRHRLSNYEMDKIHFAPSIPSKKLSGALAAYGAGIKPSDVVALVDDTVFGGAKEGILLTNKEIRFKEIFTAPEVRAVKHVEYLMIDGRSIYANGVKVMRINVPDKDEVESLLGAVNEFVGKRNEEKKTAQNTVSLDVDSGDIAGLFNKLQHYGILDKIAEGYGMGGYSARKKHFISFCLRLLSRSLRIRDVRLDGERLSGNLKEVLSSDAVAFESLLFTLACANYQFGHSEEGAERMAHVLLYLALPYLALKEGLADLDDIGEMSEAEVTQMMSRSKMAPVVFKRLQNYQEALGYGSIPVEQFVANIRKPVDFLVLDDETKSSFTQFVRDVLLAEIVAPVFDVYINETFSAVEHEVENYLLTRSRIS